MRKCWSTCIFFINFYRWLSKQKPNTFSLWLHLWLTKEHGFTFIKLKMIFVFTKWILTGMTKSGSALSASSGWLPEMSKTCLNSYMFAHILLRVQKIIILKKLYLAKQASHELITWPTKFSKQHFPESMFWRSDVVVQVTSSAKYCIKPRSTFKKLTNFAKWRISQN